MPMRRREMRAELDDESPKCNQSLSKRRGRSRKREKRPSGPGTRTRMDKARERMQT